jgi:hypothetical protein
MNPTTNFENWAAKTANFYFFNFIGWSEANLTSLKIGIYFCRETKPIWLLSLCKKATNANFVCFVIGAPSFSHLNI